MIVEINLVPDVKRQLLRAQAMRVKMISIAIIITIVSGGVLAVLSSWVFGVQAIAIGVNDNSVKSQYSKLVSSNPDLDKVLTIQNQLSTLSSLNSQKNVYSRVFSVLSSILPDDVQATEIKLDATESTLSIQGQSPDSYPALELFKKMVAGTKFYYDGVDKDNAVNLADNLTVSEVSYGEDSNNQKVLRFTLSFTYPVDLFAPATTNIHIFQSVDGNVTDSYLGVPKEVFTEKATDLQGGSNG